MIEVRATDFARNFAEYQQRVRSEPVAVTEDGKATGYYIGVAVYEELQRYRAMATRSFATGELPAETIRKIAKTEMDRRHGDLD